MQRRSSSLPRTRPGVQTLRCHTPMHAESGSHEPSACLVSPGARMPDTLRPMSPRRAASSPSKGGRFDPTAYVRQQREKEEVLAARLGRNPTPPRGRWRSDSLDMRRTGAHALVVVAQFRRTTVVPELIFRSVTAHAGDSLPRGRNVHMSRTGLARRGSDNTLWMRHDPEIGGNGVTKSAQS